MIFGVMLISDGEEAKKICRFLSELTAHNTEEKLDIQIYSESSLLASQMENMDLLDLALIDITLPGALEGARLLRRRFLKAEILVIADVFISPMEYMQPSIHASSLLLRPASSEWRTALKEFYGQLLSRNKKEDQEDVLWIENRDGIFRVPFNHIYYVEARDKKIFVRTQTEEFGINGTIEKVSAQLPENFVRCHRSFVVNRKYISQIKLSENMLYLGKKLFVPVSRSYKGEFKRWLDE